MLQSLKYSTVKFLEKNPYLQMLIYNNLFLNFSSQDKDYLGLKLLFNKNETRTFRYWRQYRSIYCSFREMGFEKIKY